MITFSIFSDIFYCNIKNALAKTIRHTIINRNFRKKPDLIVSFGGFISVPIVIAAKFFRIKSITHEQTTSTGLANNINEKYLRYKNTEKGISPYLCLF
jgi:UDP-N-acetylglucosamine:LPS N-acetylglucosamine transferase